MQLVKVSSHLLIVGLVTTAHIDIVAMLINKDNGVRTCNLGELQNDFLAGNIADAPHER